MLGYGRALQHSCGQWTVHLLARKRYPYEQYLEPVYDDMPEQQMEISPMHMTGHTQTKAVMNQTEAVGISGYLEAVKRGRSIGSGTLQAVTPYLIVIWKRRWVKLLW